MAYYIDDDTIEKIRESADIVNIVSDYVPLKRAGSNYVGLCPFHNEKTPSFTVSEDKQFYHCFGCGEGGDAVNFIMKLENLSFPDSIKFLGDKLGIEIEEKKDLDIEKIEKKDRAYEINRDVARYYFSNLQNNKMAFEYLKNRDLNVQTMRKFGLGYAKDSWHDLEDYLVKKGYDNKELEELGLVGRRKDNTGYYDKFRNRIIFPIIDTKSRVIGFGGRVLDNSNPKYLNSMETIVFNKGRNLYGMNLVHKESDRKRIILVEGYMDVISLYRNGINYAVASLGTAFTEEQAKIMKRYGKHVYICFDSDLAGVKATKKVIDIMAKVDIDPKVIVLGQYKDPDEFFEDKTLKDFETRINESLNPIEYSLYINKKRYNLDDLEDKIQFTMEIANDLKKIKNPIEKDIYIDKISKELNITRQALEKEVFGRTNYNKRTWKEERPTILPVKNILPSANLTAEIDLVKIMSSKKEYFDYLREKDVLGLLKNFECIEIYYLLEKHYIDDEIIDENIIYSSLLNKENIDGDVLNYIRNREIGVTQDNVYKAMDDLINTIKYNNTEIKRDIVKNNIKKLEEKIDRSDEESQELARLCIELIEINKELNNSR